MVAEVGVVCAHGRQLASQRMKVISSSSRCSSLRCVCRLVSSSRPFKTGALPVRLALNPSGHLPICSRCVLAGGPDQVCPVCAVPSIKVVNHSGYEVELARPFTWRGRWWPLHLCMDPPNLPLPLPCDPLLLRWFEPDASAGGTAELWAARKPACTRWHATHTHAPRGLD